jgi:hypothetical protein
MIHIADIINRKADHIIVWKDENGWHTENWGNDNLLPVYGDLADVLAQGQNAKDVSPAREYFLVEFKVVHNFRSTSDVL